MAGEPAAVAGLDDDDLEALAAWLEQRRAARGAAQSRADLEARIDALSTKTLSDEEVERIAQAVVKLAADGSGASDGGAGSGDPPPGPGKSKGDAGDDDPPPATKKTRPGRRNGNVYSWDVDEAGNVVELDTAKVFQGDDEPDEVEVPA